MPEKTYTVRIHPRVGAQLQRHAEFIAQNQHASSNKIQKRF